MAEPQITEIASCFATRLPSDGTDPDEAREAWRRALRHARSTGAADWLAGLVEREVPEDPEVRRQCEALRGRDGDRP